VGPATIGLTGGIGSGKSTVAQALVACGAHLVDTDAISRQLTTAGGAAMPSLAQQFGPQALAADGALNRDFMRQLVFSSPSAKAQLEAVLHPLIGAEALRLAALAAGKPVVFDVPLLAESDAASNNTNPKRPWRERVQQVLVVDCLEARQISRVAQRPGWTEAAAARVVAQQASRSARRAVADAVLFNDCISLQELHAQVSALWGHWFARQA
jgi:dephospho-CoA kinase